MGWVTTYDLRVERCPRARSIGMRRAEDAMAQWVDQPPRSRLASLPLFYRVISGQRSYRARAQSLPRAGAGVVSPLPTPLFPVPHSLSLLSASIPLPPRSAAAAAACSLSHLQSASFSNPPLVDNDPRNQRTAIIAQSWCP